MKGEGESLSFQIMYQNLKQKNANDNNNNNIIFDTWVFLDLLTLFKDLQ